MSYTAITAGEIATGQPTSQPLFQKIADNFAIHETNIDSLLAGSTSRIPIDFIVTGNFLVEDGVLYYRLGMNITVNAARLIIPKAGTSGTTQVDLKYKRGGGSYTSIFSTLPAVTYTAGDLGDTSGAPGTGLTAPIYSTTSLLAGDYLRLDSKAAQSGSSSPGYVFLIEFTPT